HASGGRVRRPEQGGCNHHEREGGPNIERGVDVTATLSAEGEHHRSGEHRQHHWCDHQMVGEAGHGSGSRPSTWSVPVKPRDASRTTRNSAVVAKLITMAVKTSACGSGSARYAGTTPRAARIGAGPVRSRPMAMMKRLTA